MWGVCDVAASPRRRVSRVETVAVPADADLRAAIKAYLRIETADEDALIDRLAASAIGHCEMFIGRMVVIREARETLSVERGWQRLRATPVRAVSGVEGLDAGGAAGALPIEAYAIDMDAAGDAWVRILEPGTACVARVTYTAGLASGFAGLPEPIAQGIVRLATHLFAMRDAADEGAPPAAVAALWRPWRRLRIL